MAKIDPVVNVDINNLFYQLHETALKEAKTKTNDVDIVNLGVDYDNQSFVGAGDFIIVAQLGKNSKPDLPKTEPDKFKQQCKDALVIYTYIFAGDDVASKLKSNEDAFKPIYEQVAPNGESITSLSLSQLLMEDAPSVNDNKKSCIGYYIEYNTSIEGQKKHRWYDLAKNSGKFFAKGILSALTSAAKDTASGMFGDVFKDLQSLKINIGGKDHNIGAQAANALKAVADGTKEVVTIAGQKFIKAFGKTDLEDLNRNFSKAITDEFPNTRATTHIYNVDALITKLRKARKLDASVQQKLMKNGKIMRMEHIITLDVGKNDPAYEQYDVDSLYRCFIDALNETKTFSSLKGMPDLLQRLTSTFSKDDIVKIDNYDTSLSKNRVRRGSVTADSIDTKQLFMKSVLGGLSMLNEDAHEDEMKAKIWNMLKDTNDDTKPSESAMKTIAHEFSIMDSDDYKDYGAPSAYPNPSDLSNALRSSATKDEVDKIIDAFIDEGNIDKLYKFIKRKFGIDDTSAGSAASDVYLFCLANVLRQKDEEKQKKVKKD